MPKDWGRQYSALTGKPILTSEEKLQQAAPMLDFATAVTPIVGDLRDVGEVISNRPFMGEREFSQGERLATYLGAAAPFIPGSILRRAINTEWVNKFRQYLRRTHGEEAAKRFKQPIPGFKTSGEAIDFGRQANAEQIARMQEMEKNLETAYNGYMKEGMLQDAMNAATAKQFISEALEASKGIVRKSDRR